MPFPVVAAMAAGSTLAGGVLGNRARSGQAERDRRFQSTEARTSRAWQSAEAETSRQYQTAEAATQMGFQERMRNTEWQAGVEDMRAAGLNPALAYSQGGASAPMGARGSGAQGGGAAGSGSTARQEDVLSGAVSSALQYRRASAEIKGIQATTKRTAAETAQVEGRVTRAFEPAVSVTEKAIDDLLEGRVFNMKNARIIAHEVGTSAKSIFRAMRDKFRPRTIGPDTTRRR